jgi:hypothetical protein
MPHTPTAQDYRIALLAAAQREVLRLNEKVRSTLTSAAIDALASLVSERAAELPHNRTTSIPA